MQSHRRILRILRPQPLINANCSQPFAFRCQHIAKTGRPGSRTRFKAYFSGFSNVGKQVSIHFRAQFCSWLDWLLVSPAWFACSGSNWHFSGFAFMTPRCARRILAAPRSHSHLPHLTLIFSIVFLSHIFTFIILPRTRLSDLMLLYWWLEGGLTNRPNREIEDGQFISIEIYFQWFFGVYVNGK